MRKAEKGSNVVYSQVRLPLTSDISLTGLIWQKCKFSGPTQVLSRTWGGVHQSVFGHDSDLELELPVLSAPQGSSITRPLGAGQKGSISGLSLQIHWNSSHFNSISKWFCVLYSLGITDVGTDSRTRLPVWAWAKWFIYLSPLCAL